MVEPIPVDHEAHLRAMLTTRGYTLDFSPPDLSSTDQAAIRWALEELERLRVERDTACQLERERWEKLPGWARGKTDGP